MKSYNKIIFVGQNGTCRAPMAEAILKEYHINRTIDIESCGIVSLFPEPLNQKAEAVLISNGIFMEEYTSRQLSREDFAEDTLLITMEQTQKESILREYDEATEENVQVLTQLVGDELEILNPHGGTLQSYGLCYETLNNSIKKLVEKINGED